LNYNGPDRRAKENISVAIAQIKGDISQIALKMEIHDEQSQSFRKCLISKVEKIETAIHGNGKIGILESIRELQTSAERGKAAWKWLLSVCSITAGGLLLYYFKRKLGL